MNWNKIIIIKLPKKKLKKDGQKYKINNRQEKEEKIILQMREL